MQFNGIDIVAGKLVAHTGRAVAPDRHVAPHGIEGSIGIGDVHHVILGTGEEVIAARSRRDVLQELWTADREGIGPGRNNRRAVRLLVDNDRFDLWEHVQCLSVARIDARRARSIAIVLNGRHICPRIRHKKSAGIGDESGAGIGCHIMETLLPERAFRAARTCIINHQLTARRRHVNQSPEQRRKQGDRHKRHADRERLSVD